MAAYTYKPPSTDPYERAFDHVRRMPDSSRVPFLRGVIDSINENGSDTSRKEACKILDQLTAPPTEDRPAADRGGENMNATARFGQ